MLGQEWGGDDVLPDVPASLAHLQGVLMSLAPPTTVLMYHAVSDNAGACAGADPHYAVNRAQFSRHLETVRSAEGTPASVLSLLQRPNQAAVAFTFDDGHESNAWAAEALHRVGGAGDFFVNSSTIGAPHQLSWSALRDMADSGMSIQSHGHQHRFLDELTPAEVEGELVISKRILEDKLGRAVELFAPPGGRAPANLYAVATRLGYVAVCSSRVGLWRNRARSDVPRLAVFDTTSDAQLLKWVRQDYWELLNRRIRYRVLTSGKRILGNASYERVRRILLRQASTGR